MQYFYTFYIQYNSILYIQLQFMGVENLFVLSNGVVVFYYIHEKLSFIKLIWNFYEYFSICFVNYLLVIN